MDTIVRRGELRIELALRVARQVGDVSEGRIPDAAPSDVGRRDSCRQLAD